MIEENEARKSAAQVETSGASFVSDTQNELKRNSSWKQEHTTAGEKIYTAISVIHVWKTVDSILLLYEECGMNV